MAGGAKKHGASFCPVPKQYSRVLTFSPQLRILSTAELNRDKLTAIYSERKNKDRCNRSPCFLITRRAESSISHRRDQCTLLAHWTLRQTLLLPRTTPLAAPFQIALVAAAPAIWKQEQRPSRQRPVHGRVQQQVCVLWFGCVSRERWVERKATVK